MHCALYESPLGLLTLRSNGDALYSLQFGAAEEQGDRAVFLHTFHWLDAWFQGVELPRPHLLMRGSPFCLKVWEHCMSIPMGQTRSYGELARAVGRPGAARAVGTALRHNPLLIIIPCHRVLPAAGGIGQYVAGPTLKRLLLQQEKAGSCAAGIMA